MKKRISIILLAGTLSIFLFSILVHASFSDIDGHKYQEAIEFISERDVVDGYPDGTFQPDRVMNRAELLTILISHKYSNLPSKDCFTDVKANKWYAKYVCKGRELGIVAGYPDGSFKPGQDVNFVEALIMLQRAYNLPVNPDTGEAWYTDSVLRASSMNIIPLDTNSFSQKYTRGQMAEMVARLIKYQESTLDEYLGSKKNFVVMYDNIQSGTIIENRWLACQRNSSLEICSPQTPPPSPAPSPPPSPAPPVPEKAVSVDIKANGYDDLLIIESGEKINLSWSTKGNIISCTSSGNWHGNRVLGNGQFETEILNGPQTYTYTLNCDSPEASFVSDAVIVSVKDSSAGINSEICNDMADNDGDGYIDCYDTDCADYTGEVADFPRLPTKDYFHCDLYQGAQTFIGTGIHTIHNMDRIQFTNGMIGQFIFENNSAYVLLYYIQNGKILVIDRLLVTPRNTPFISNYGAYAYMLTNPFFGDENWTIQVFDNCTAVYNKCISDERITSMAGYVEDRVCELMACPYEEIPGYSSISNGKFQVVYPDNFTNIQTIAQRTLDYLPGCYNSIKNVFGSEPPVQKFTVRYFDVDSQSFGAARAERDNIGVALQSHWNENYFLEQLNSSAGGTCDLGYFALGHELTHIFDRNTPYFKEATEGFADYISRRFTEGSVAVTGYPLVCTEAGYYYSIYGSSTPMPYEGESVYPLGECFWQLLEKKYGVESVDLIIKKMASLRGHSFYYNFARDIVAPITGESSYVNEIIKRLGWNSNCTFANFPLNEGLCIQDYLSGRYN